MNAFSLIVARDLRLAFRRWSALATPLIFFVIVASLFPLALSPEASQLRDAGTGILWVSALLSSLLALDGLFRADTEDGSMEQLVLSPVPLGVIVLAKTLAHWIVSGAPLIVLAPLLALSFYLPTEALPTLIIALTLATPTLSVLAAIGASLTVSLRGGGAIIGLLVLPLTSPLLIFGTRATDLAVHGEATAGPLYLLAALAVMAISLGPLATAAALKVGLE
jgi:heme exporter protein B